MRLINDIRLSGLEEFSKEAMRSSKPFLFRKYNMIGRRYAAKLHSLAFDVGLGGEIFVLQMKASQSHGDVKPDFDGPCRSYTCGLDPLQMDELQDLELQDFFAGCITRMMLQASSRENLATEKVHLVNDLILRERENMGISLASSANEKWSARVEYRICDNSALSVIVEDLDSSKAFKAVELPLDEFQDAQKMARTIKIKKSSVSVISRHGIEAEHTLKRYSERLGMLGIECCKNHFVIQLPQS